MSQNRPPFPKVMPAPPPEVVTETHIHNALDILLGLQPYLLNAPGDHAGTPESRKLDEKSEAGIAAEATFIRACTRLDTLLADETRWGLDTQKSLYSLLEKNYQQQFQFLASQTAASNNLSRPAFLWKPEIVRTEDGDFVVYIGDVTSPGCGLLGKGKTPNEAFADFDAAFFRAEQHRLENADPTPKPKRKKTK